MQEWLACKIRKRQERLRLWNRRPITWTLTYASLSPRSVLFPHSVARRLKKNNWSNYSDEMTYLGLLCWFSGDGASCLKTVSDGKARRASLKEQTKFVKMTQWYSSLSYLISCRAIFQFYLDGTTYFSHVTHDTFCRKLELPSCKSASSENNLEDCLSRLFQLCAASIFNFFL